MYELKSMALVGRMAEMMVVLQHMLKLSNMEWR
jgi:hypothetical protein